MLITKSDTENKIYTLIEPTILDMGFEVIRIQYIDSETATLQIMIEKKHGGTEITDCATISKTVSTLLDVDDPIEQKYNLEVSSPGINRPLTRLKDFESWHGYEIKIKTHELISNRKRFTGVLKGVLDNEILLEIPEGTIGIHQDWIAEASLSLSTKQIMDQNKENKINPIDESDFDKIETE
jgi:ribosome maturation factor RimP